MSEPAEKNAWDRVPGEGTKAHRAFRAYLDRRSERSLAQCSFDTKVNPTLLKRWSATWGWVARAAAWDAHCDRIEMEQKERVIRRKAELWAERQMKAAEHAWDEAEMLREWGAGALKAARVKGTIGAIVKVFQAAGATRERAVVIALQSLSEDDAFDPITATAEQLRAYLAKRGVKSASSPQGEPG